MEIDSHHRRNNLIPGQLGVATPSFYVKSSIIKIIFIWKFVILEFQLSGIRKLPFSGTVHQNLKKIVGIKIENSVKENQWFLGDCVNIAVIT